MKIFKTTTIGKFALLFLACFLSGNLLAQFTPPVTITSYSPHALRPGPGVTDTIIGTGFSATASQDMVVLDHGSSGTGLPIESATTTRLIVFVPAGTPTGSLSVLVNFSGMGFPLDTLTMIYPIITSCSPLTASTGMTISIKGKYFTGATAVTFGGTAATSYTTVSDTLITAIVGSGSSGNIVVAESGSSGTYPNFTYSSIPIIDSSPVINSFSPLSVAAGITDTITGKFFTGATNVSFGGTPAASFTIVSDTVITAVMGTGSSGYVSVTTQHGVGSLGGFLFAHTPILSSFVHIKASSGDAVALKGKYFTGATSVTFGGTNAASFIVASDTVINVVMGNGASGSVVVTTANGIASLPGFVYGGTQGANVTHFSPDSATSGATVTFTGSYLSDIKEVFFGGTLATSFSSGTGNSFTAVVGTGASGNIDINSIDDSTGYGVSTLTPGFVFIPLSISSFSPTQAGVGDTIAIKGVGFNNASAVWFGGWNAASFVIVADTLIKAVISSNDASGNVTVVTRFGNASVTGYTFTTVIAGFIATPISGCVPLSVNFTNNSISGHGGAYRWYFGDGNISTSPVVTYTYNTPGQYTVKFVVYSSSGPYSDSITKTNYITVYSKPSVGFLSAPTNASTDSTIIYQTQGGQTNYQWTFSGTANTDYTIIAGSTTTDSSVSIKWLTNGSKTVTVNYENGNGCPGQLATTNTTVTAADLWTGAVSTAWEDPGNWSTGVVPDSTTDVVINSGTIIVSSNATVKSLTLNPAANLTVSSGYNLTITH